MKLREGFRLRKVGNKYIVVGLGGINFTGLITVNDTGAFIWHMLEKGAETGEIIDALAKECDVEPMSIASEVAAFIYKLKGAGLIE
ncbi:MAG: PqqD family protein [Clostridia bacterium]|nr:PqqD family protein [Clostridia bacterium]